jgi:hypothetical protein
MAQRFSISSAHFIHRERRLEINVVSTQVKKIRAISIPKLIAGARRSRGGINSTSVNSFSGGQVTLTKKHKQSI